MNCTGSSRATNYLFVNYLLSQEENNRKLDEKLAANVRRETLLLARNALLRIVKELRSVTESAAHSTKVPRA
jgi:hypothetical protein